MEWMTDPTLWVGLLTLVLLEIVLGIDNLIFIAILADKLPTEQRDRARIVGLGLALFMRLGLLASISWVMSLTEPLFTLGGLDISWRDIILIAGGGFLLVKATIEIHERLEVQAEAAGRAPTHASFWPTIAQIVVLDIVFSLDSVITAVGMVDQVAIMVLAIVIAVGVMMFAAKPIGEFVDHHPTVKMLALSFLILVGLALIAEGGDYHIPKGYIYFAMAFSVGVEMLNLRAKAKREAIRLRKHLPA